MAVTASGDAGQQIAIRAGPRGLRVAGTLVGITALVNVSLALVAMHAGSLVGIALATVVAQSLQNLLSSAYACRRLQLRWWSWSLRAWALPVTVVLLAGWLRLHLPLSTPEHRVLFVNVALLAGAYAALILASAAFLGITFTFVRDELAILRGFVKR
jgi:peptidoglycan biosynthesis protein MviN/MurJ (putative lipid II flippase)